jgi:hypothetical protein
VADQQPEQELSQRRLKNKVFVLSFKIAGKDPIRDCL